MKSIGLKLWSGMMLLVFFMLLLLWLFQIVFLDQFYLDRQISGLSEKSGDWVKELQLLTDLSSITTNSAIQDKLAAFAYTYQLNIEILDENGLMIYQPTSNSEQQSPNMFKKSIQELAGLALKGRSVQTTLEHPRFGNTFLVIGIPIYKNTSVVGVFIVNAPLAPVSDTADILKQQLIVITAILLLAASILSYMISRHFSKPILKISMVAREMAKGKFDVRIRKVSNDEIGQLATNINEMGLELGKTDKLRKELVGNISHELRTPLSLIRGYAETIRDVSGNQAEKREKHLGIIIEESERLGRLIEDILGLSQLEVGTVKLELKCFNMKELVSNVNKGFEDLAGKREISLVMKGDLDTLVFCDERRIEQVLYNLIGNAFQHTEDGGHIEVVTQLQNASIKVEIKDTGVGIPREELDSIWERYYKATTPKNEKISGTGLGLTIVKSILVAHQVQYGVESTVGVGTTFWFMLNRYKQ